MKIAAAALTVVFLASAPALSVAQAPPAPRDEVTQTYRLNSAGMSAAFGTIESNEILTALRNILPSSARIILVPNQNAFVVVAAPDVQKMVPSLLRDLDQPHPLYRLTYTFTESDGGKRLGVQRCSMVLESGQRLVMKEGSRVPVLTGAKQGGTDQQTTYIDVGLSFDSTVQEYGAGFQLKSKVERSALAAETGMVAGMPIIRQTLLEGVSLIGVGKPAALGSIDLPGSTRHLDVEATVEVVK